jgi:hypothetical protein
MGLTAQRSAPHPIPSRLREGELNHPSRLREGPGVGASAASLPATGLLARCNNHQIGNRPSPQMINSLAA